jgi:DNA repair exonuclease SbcCD ATPase subunit
LTLNIKKEEIINLSIMKKVFVFAMCCVALASCNLGKNSDAELRAIQERDSLNQIIAQRDNELNDMMSTFNEIEEGFRVINEAEGRVNLARSGEGTNATARIRENMQFIQTTMEQNRALIAKLQQQMKNSNVKADALQKAIDNLTKELELKDQQIAELQAELESKNIHIAELNQRVTELNTDVETLTETNTQQQQTISTQDRELNTAYFVFGTKKELKNQGILDGGGLFKKAKVSTSYNNEYFTKIDIRTTKEIKLYSNKAEIKTSHPAGSYSLEKDANGQYVLQITNPSQFWNNSKYLVIVVK